jgi:hypothetical protein
MKKTLLLIVVAMVTGICTYAQSLALADSSGPVANNSTVNRYGHALDDVIACYLFVTNTTTHDISVITKKVEIGVLPGTVNTFCWGLCFPPDVFVSPPRSVAAMSTDSTGFSGDYNPLGIVGTSVIRYVFYDESNPSDSVCANVAFNAWPVGIQNTNAKSMLGSAFPNPAGSKVSLSYSLTAGETGSLVVRNVLGSKVKEEVLAGTDGKIILSVTDLPDGIYFYSLNIDGKSSLTRKLIVKH